MDSKICTSCKQTKPLSEFCAHTRSKDRKEYYCKKCKWNKYGSIASSKWKTNRKLTLEGFIKHLIYEVNKRKREVTIDYDYILKLYYKQEGLCALSKIPMTYGNHTRTTKSDNFNISIDRIDSSKGYTTDNVQLVCASINSMKNDFIQGNFINVCKLIANNN